YRISGSWMQPTVEFDRAFDDRRPWRIEMSRVAAIQMISGADVQANLDAAAVLLAEAAQQGAELVLLPECFAAFGNRSLQEIAAAEWAGSGPIRPFLAAQARQHGLWLVGGSIPLPATAGGKAMACCLVV